MNYASSLVKSTYNGVKYAAKYATKSASKYMGTNDSGTTNSEVKTQKVSWVSCIIFFKTPYNQYVVDQTCILVGNIPNNYHAFLTNFTNWLVHGNQLFYRGEIYDQRKKKNVTMMEIDPSNVHVHFKVGDAKSNMDYFYNNPSHFSYYFSGPKAKLYKLLSKELKNINIKVIDLTGKFGPLCSDILKERSEKIIDPRFLNVKHQIYGQEMQHIMYSGINLAMIS